MEEKSVILFPRYTLEERIRSRAHDLWVIRGESVSAEDNWIEAERQVLEEARKAYVTATRAAAAG